MLIIDTLHSIARHTNNGYNLWKNCATLNVGPRFQLHPEVTSKAILQQDKRLIIAHKHTSQSFHIKTLKYHTIMPNYSSFVDFTL
jgi:hypothetical protein